MRSASVLLILSLLTGCARQQAGPPTVEVVFRLERATFTVEAEVADQPVEWQRGLMNRAELGDDEGMLFVFADAREHTFWMKDTPLALDLISIRGGRVVDIQTMQPCPADPCPRTATPVIDAALEVKAGTAERAGIKPGALVEAEVLP